MSAVSGLCPQCPHSLRLYRPKGASYVVTYCPKCAYVQRLDRRTWEPVPEPSSAPVAGCRPREQRDRGRQRAGHRRRL